MQRVLAKVIEIKKIREVNEGNFRIIELKYKVKIKESASKGFKLPPHIKGKIGWLTRIDVMPWETKNGDEIILNPDEVKLFIPEIEGDLNFDGHKEEVVENEFLKAIILPHYGAKIGSLIYKADGVDKFRLALKYGKDEWLDMGGADTLIDSELPGTLWNADFKIKSEGVYEYEKGGIKITKQSETLSKLPILYEKITVKSKKKKSINFWHRISFDIGDRWWENVLFLPTKEKLQHRRYSKFSLAWRLFPEYYGLKLGAWLFTNNKGSLLWLTNPKTIDFVSVTDERFAFIIAPHTIPMELKKGDEAKYGCLWVIGESYDINSNTVSIGSRAILGNNKILFSIVARSKKPVKSAQIYWEKKEDAISLEPIRLEEVGEILVGKILIEAPSETNIKFKL